MRPTRAPSVHFATAPGLHGETRLKAREAVSGDPIHFLVGAAIVGRLDADVATVRIFPRQIEQVYASKDGEEATEERNSVDGVGRVESAEEDERRDQCEGRERHVVQRVHTAGIKVSYCIRLIGIEGEVTCWY